MVPATRWTRPNYFQPIQVRGPNATLRVQTLPDFPTDDLDLFLLDADDNLAAVAATGASAEQFTVRGLPKGEYRIVVEAFAVHDSEPSTTFDVRTFQVGGNAGNLSVTPTSQPVQAGKSVDWHATSPDSTPTRRTSVRSAGTSSRPGRRRRWARP